MKTEKRITHISPVFGKLPGMVEVAVETVELDSRGWPGATLSREEHRIVLDWSVLDAPDRDSAIAAYVCAELDADTEL